MRDVVLVNHLLSGLAWVPEWPLPLRLLISLLVYITWTSRFVCNDIVWPVHVDRIHLHSIILISLVRVLDHQWGLITLGS